jgi:hypothetical protein
VVGGLVGGLGGLQMVPLSGEGRAGGARDGGAGSGSGVLSAAPDDGKALLPLDH